MRLTSLLPGHSACPRPPSGQLRRNRTLGQKSRRPMLRRLTVPVGGHGRGTLGNIVCKLGPPWGGRGAGFRRSALATTSTHRFPSLGDLHHSSVEWWWTRGADRTSRSATTVEPDLLGGNSPSVRIPRTPPHRTLRREPPSRATTKIRSVARRPPRCSRRRNCPRKIPVHRGRYRRNRDLTSSITALSSSIRSSLAATRNTGSPARQPTTGAPMLTASPETNHDWNRTSTPQPTTTLGAVAR